MAGDNLEEYKGQSDEFLSKSPWKRFQIIFCGPLLNYLLGFLFFWCVMFMGYPAFTGKVGGLLDGYGAKEAGLQIGDKIIYAGGAKVELWEDLQKQIQKHKQAGKLELKVLRANQEMSFNVNINQNRMRGVIGVKPSGEVVIIKHGFLESAFFSAQKCYELTVLTYMGLWQLVTGKVSMRESMTGPLGIFFITSTAASMGLVAVMHLVAVLSISLAIFNLLPLPILDGGHIFLLGLEKLRKRGLSINAEKIVNNLGLVLIIGLAVFVTYNDIIRLYSDKFSKLITK